MQYRGRDACQDRGQYRGRRLFMLSAFPPGEVYGGQLRAWQVLESYRRLGFEASGACAKRHNVRDYPGFLMLDGLEEFFGYPGGQHLFYKGFEAKPALTGAFEEYFLAFNPDVVLFEEPWFYGFFQHLRPGLLDGKIVIFDAHNLEHEMVAQHLGQSIEPFNQLCIASNVVELTRDLEVSLARRADVVTCCTMQEVKFFTEVRQGASQEVHQELYRENAVHLVPHGAHLGGKPKSCVELAERVAFFVSSGHVPNTRSLLEFLGGSSLFIPPHCKLVIAGNITIRLQAYFAQNPSVAAAWLPRITILRSLSRQELLEWYARADVIILPVLYGSGANLKTVEALLTDRAIVATKFAFRGYEGYQNSPGVAVYPDFQAMRHGVREALLAPRGSFVRNLEAELDWTLAMPSCLAAAIHDIKFRTALPDLNAQSLGGSKSGGGAV